MAKLRPAPLATETAPARVAKLTLVKSSVPPEIVVVPV